MPPNPAGIVVVGASLAGLRGAEALRRGGYDGPLTLVGAEPYRPYDRPPLSKHVLAGELAADATRLPELAELRARWRLGSPGVALDRAARTLRLAAAPRHRAGRRGRPRPRRCRRVWGSPRAPLVRAGLGADGADPAGLPRPLAGAAPLGPRRGVVGKDLVGAGRRR
ncbi:FAD-dependent oxidoreductase, partial [Methylobacterium radiotolerans]|uniref:FAD-dependent oxidoreductase n=1 Tax=Methylobacterium radiotolerans TaxID=31998 RepID=UPI001FDA5CB0